METNFNYKNPASTVSSKTNQKKDKREIFTPYFDILTEMNERKIYSRNKLKSNPELYTKYWDAANGFAVFCLSSKTTTNKNGEVLPGNVYRVNALVDACITTRDELVLDCTIKLVDSLDKFIYNKESVHRTVKHQYNCAYASINHLVADMFDRLPPKGIKIVSWDSPIDSETNEGGTSISEITGDDRYNGERILIDKENTKEIINERRMILLKELEAISKNPSYLLVHIACVRLNIKPRDLAKSIVINGLEATYNNVLHSAAATYQISYEELRNIITNKPLNAKHFKTDTNDVLVVSSKIHNIKNRMKFNIEPKKR